MVLGWCDGKTEVSRDAAWWMESQIGVVLVKKLELKLCWCPLRKQGGLIRHRAGFCGCGCRHSCLLPSVYRCGVQFARQRARMRGLSLTPTAPRVSVSSALSPTPGSLQSISAAPLALP